LSKKSNNRNSEKHSNHMSTIHDKAIEYLQAGLSVIPTKADKTPALPAWKNYQSQIMTKAEADTYFVKSTSLAIICGAVSGNVEVIDVDVKHDATGKLWDTLSELIKDVLPDTYSRLVIAETPSGGYHLYYKSEAIDGNKKLAKNEAKEVIIETRGEAGYVLAYPSPGYAFIQGDPTQIPTISKEERDTLLGIARSFNEIEDAPAIPSTPRQSTYTATGISPWEDYDQRGDVVGLLLNKRWTVYPKNDPERIYLRRPGNTPTKYSGNFHTGKRKFIVFSSSTDFTSELAYSPSDVFKLLECSGDKSLAYRRLRELGYGDDLYSGSLKPTLVRTERITVEAVNRVTGETSVIASPGGSLKIEELQDGQRITITPGADATSEDILRALEFIQRDGKQASISTEAGLIRDYTYQLQAIINKYTDRDHHQGGLNDQDIDDFKDEIVTTGARLQPLDRDTFNALLLKQEGIQALGITKESLEDTQEKLRQLEQTQKQREVLAGALQKAYQAQDAGDVAGALSTLKAGITRAEQQGVKELLPPAITYSGILEAIAQTPASYKTGYDSLDNFVGFPPGAITLVAGRPGHGKTSFMMNLLTRMSQAYPGQTFYFFSYEEARANLAIKIINHLAGADLRGYYKNVPELTRLTNYDFIKHYIRNQRTDIKELEQGKQLFSELWDSGRIRVVDKNYSVENLSKIITHIQKTEPLGAVIIDYVQRMNTERKTQDKRTEIAHISDQVLQIAKNSGLPIILGAQLNREAVDSKGSKPRLENLKEAGNLEEDANTVLSVYCEAREKEQTAEGKEYSKKRVVELEVKALKNREGEVNRMQTLYWDRWTQRITDPSEL
jgi:replicative DNA helicase